ncbi:hypothetical protein EV421DRAFT_1742847 [Armillaria borealis]|uniref:Uncharacterized protein n=1 Tax=Armillaria borealis TaxID=47425 RepID=A0AA39IXR8_9AGAR|nr:hypothetical protein EV421DRAFT_1742847 [Armillaria borealis]
MAWKVVALLEAKKFDEGVQGVGTCVANGKYSKDNTTSPVSCNITGHKMIGKETEQALPSICATMRTVQDVILSRRKILTTIHAVRLEGNITLPLVHVSLTTMISTAIRLIPIKNNGYKFLTEFQSFFGGRASWETTFGGYGSVPFTFFLSVINRTTATLTEMPTVPISLTKASGKPSIGSPSLDGSASTTFDNGIIAVHNTKASGTNPARVAAAITVGATTIAGARASFSNYSNLYVSGLVAYFIRLNGNLSSASISNLVKSLGTSERFPRTESVDNNTMWSNVLQRAFQDPRKDAGAQIPRLQIRFYAQQDLFDGRRMQFFG